MPPASPRRFMPVLLLTLLTLLASCQVPAQGPAVASRHAARWIRTDLYFGLTRRDSSPIADADFQAFIDTTVTPSFPDGLTITPAAGQYLDSKKLLHQEPARILTVLYPRKEAAANDEKIKIISAAYCRQFDQESVLRTESRADTEFLSGSR